VGTQEWQALRAQLTTEGAPESTLVEGYFDLITPIYFQSGGDGQYEVIAIIGLFLLLASVCCSSIVLKLRANNNPRASRRHRVIVWIPFLLSSGILLDGVVAKDPTAFPLIAIAVFLLAVGVGVRNFFDLRKHHRSNSSPSDKDGTPKPSSSWRRLKKWVALPCNYVPVASGIAAGIVAVLLWEVGGRGPGGFFFLALLITAGLWVFIWRRDGRGRDRPTTKQAVDGENLSPSRKMTVRLKGEKLTTPPTGIRMVLQWLRRSAPEIFAASTAVLVVGLCWNLSHLDRCWDQKRFPTTIGCKNLAKQTEDSLQSETTKGTEETLGLTRATSITQKPTNQKRVDSLTKTPPYLDMAHVPGVATALGSKWNGILVNFWLSVVAILMILLCLSFWRFQLARVDRIYVEHLAAVTLGFVAVGILFGTMFYGLFLEAAARYNARAIVWATIVEKFQTAQKNSIGPSREPAPQGAALDSIKNYYEFCFGEKACFHKDFLVCKETSEFFSHDKPNLTRKPGENHIRSLAFQGTIQFTSGSSVPKDMLPLTYRIRLPETKDKTACNTNGMVIENFRTFVSELKPLRSELDYGYEIAVYAGADSTGEERRNQDLVQDRIEAVTILLDTLACHATDTLNTEARDAIRRAALNAKHHRLLQGRNRDSDVEKELWPDAIGVKSPTMAYTGEEAYLSRWRAARFSVWKILPDTVLLTQVSWTLSPTSSLWDMIYFSFVSITTSGYGDIKATGRLARLLVISENVLEIVFVGLFFSIFSIIPRASRGRKKRNRRRTPSPSPESSPT